MWKNSAYYVNLLGGDGFARVHHGSLSKEQRDEVERDLREGRLAAVMCHIIHGIGH